LGEVEPEGRGFFMGRTDKDPAGRLFQRNNAPRARGARRENPKTTNFGLKVLGLLSMTAGDSNAFLTRNGVYGPDECTSLSLN
jgi:hypothetical protein